MQRVEFPEMQRVEFPLYGKCRILRAMKNSSSAHGVEFPFMQRLEFFIMQHVQTSLYKM